MRVVRDWGLGIVVFAVCTFGGAKMVRHDVGINGGCVLDCSGYRSVLEEAVSRLKRLAF